MYPKLHEGILHGETVQSEPVSYLCLSATLQKAKIVA